MPDGVGHYTLFLVSGCTTRQDLHEACERLDDSKRLDDRKNIHDSKKWLSSDL
jgi:hypothetical protein